MRMRNNVVAYGRNLHGWWLSTVTSPSLPLKSIVDFYLLYIYTPNFYLLYVYG